MPAENFLHIPSGPFRLARLNVLQKLLPAALLHDARIAHHGTVFRKRHQPAFTDRLQINHRIRSVKIFLAQFTERLDRPSQNRPHIHAGGQLPELRRKELSVPFLPFFQLKQADRETPVLNPVMPVPAQKLFHSHGQRKHRVILCQIVIKLLLHPELGNAQQDHHPGNIALRQVKIGHEFMVRQRRLFSLENRKKVGSPELTGLHLQRGLHGRHIVLEQAD